MDNMRSLKKLQSGISMIEVLVTLVILMVGLLGIAGLQIQAHQAELESYQRVQALVLLQDMVDRLNNNRNVATCYAFTTTPANGNPFLGTPLPAANYADPAALACAAGTPAQQIMALADLATWNQSLQGASETIGGANAGGIIGARGCVVLENAANRVYRISVSWQGRIPTIDPAVSDPILGANTVLTCGSGNYSDERMRRIVTTTVRLGILS